LNPFLIQTLSLPNNQFLADLSEHISTRFSHSIPANRHLLEKYEKTRKFTESIFKPLATEDYMAQPITNISPPKWSLGHTTWFFETFVLSNYQPGYQLFDKRFPFLFNSYYNNAGDRILRHRRGDLTRPTVDEVYDYRRYVDAAMKSFVENDIPREAMDLVELGIQHEEQHQELFWTDLKFTLSLNPMDVAYEGQLPFTDASEAAEMNFIPFHEGIVEIGASGDGFCYDNELGRHKVFLHDFEIADRLVTNGEFIKFIEQGGYQDFNCWHDEGWKWVHDEKIDAPLYWEKIDGVWTRYTLAGRQEVNPLEALAHISFYEAFAYAEWKGLRLPTEFEWEAASDSFQWGKRWEWTNSAYLPYPGFSKAEGAVGEYNGKFMVNQMVLRGASAATTPGHSRKTYRNFFHPWERWQFTGIRLAR
jgi:ergothioneine biosynthesis protein EgtB